MPAEGRQVQQAGEGLGCRTSARWYSPARRQISLPGGGRPCSRPGREGIRGATTAWRADSSPAGRLTFNQRSSPTGGTRRRVALLSAEASVPGGCRGRSRRAKCVGPTRDVPGPDACYNFIVRTGTKTSRCWRSALMNAATHGARRSAAGSKRMRSMGASEGGDARTRPDNQVSASRQGRTVDCRSRRCGPRWPGRSRRCNHDDV